MGCSVPSGFHATMSLFGRRNVNTEDNRTRLERKLYLARESPEPSFDLSQCALKNVPSGIFSLCKVFRKESVNLEENALSCLEDGGNLSDLYLLKVLNISKNRFHKLSDDIRYLVNLKELYVSHNQVKKITDHISALVCLEVFDVSHNNLKCLPPSMGKLKRLKKLSITGNADLATICVELCQATNLQVIELNPENFTFPPSDIACLDTTQIMKFLCEQGNFEYTPPGSVLGDDITGPNSPKPVMSPAEYDRSLRSQFANWEEEDENLHRMENQMHEASKKQKEKFLLEYTQEQMKLDSELNKIQVERDHDRTRLIRQIQEEEQFTEKVVLQLLELNTFNPQRMQQYLEHDQREHDRLLEMCRANYTNLKTVDTLKAMQSLLEEECQYDKSLKQYGESQSEVKESFLMQELNSNEQLGNLLKTRDALQSGLVERLLKDEDVQKAAVGVLLEKCDARSWGLVQEIALVESHLAKLSALELDRRRLKLNDNMDNLNDQRIKLSFLLVDLLDQQGIRRSQLIETLQAMELEKKTSSDFWLIRYQQLLDSIPEIVVSSQRQLDPTFANYLLQEGVIHCLPFLVHWVSSSRELATLTDEMLQKQGVRLTSDRVNILKAIKFYLEEIEATRLKMNEPEASQQKSPSAPLESELSFDEKESAVIKKEPSIIAENLTECVVCMEENCGVVFIPCGHLCCCVKCSDAVEQSCPMCRGNIERKIRVIQP